MEITVFIFARGGSKGVPNKNIKLLDNKPLIEYSINTALKLKGVETIFVSTDSAEIAEVALQSGAAPIIRPSNLAEDETPEWFAWQHAVDWVNNNHGPFETFVSLPATSPLRSVGDVTRCVDALDNSTDVVVTMTESHRSPWFNIVKKDSDNYLSHVIQSKNKIVRRQDVPESFDLTTVAYVTRPNFILKNGSIWDGRVKGVLVPKERAIDIDTEFDFSIAECLLKENGTQD